MNIYKLLYEAVQHGFWYAQNSMHDGYVPDGNVDQWIMGELGFVSKEELDEFKKDDPNFSKIIELKEKHITILNKATMNYDESLEADRELAEGAGDSAEKIWLVVLTSHSKDPFIVPFNEEEAMREEYSRCLTRFSRVAKTIEMGYVLERDYYPKDLVKTYRYFEPIETFKK